MRKQILFSLTLQNLAVRSKIPKIQHTTPPPHPLAHAWLMDHDEVAHFGMSAITDNMRQTTIPSAELHSGVPECSVPRLMMVDAANPTAKKTLEREYSTLCMG